MKLIALLGPGFGSLEQSGSAQAVRDVRCNRTEKLDVIAAERLLIGAAPNRAIAEKFARLLKNHLQQMVPAQRSVNYVVGFPPKEVIQEEILLRPDCLRWQNISERVCPVWELNPTHLRRRIYKKFAEQWSGSSDLFGATHVGVDPFTATGQHYPVRTMRNAVIETLENASNERLERQA